jgi:hypothetical protein
MLDTPKFELREWSGAAGAAADLRRPADRRCGRSSMVIHL